jgi:hypothetical protein
MECVTVYILIAWEARYDLWLSTWQCWQTGIPTVLVVHIKTLFHHQKGESYIPSKHWYAPTSFQCCNTEHHSTRRYVHLLTEYKIKCPAAYKRVNNSKMAHNSIIAMIIFKKQPHD